MRYPFIDFTQSNQFYNSGLHAAAERVINSGIYIGGPEVESLETLLARTVGTRYAVGTANGLDALKLIFRSLTELGRLHRGDEVLVSANTFIASFLAISEVGLIPVPVDADRATMNMNTALAESLVTPRTKAVLTVHLYGRMCYDSALAQLAQKYGLIIVEDSAQAIGAQTVVDGRCINAGAAGAAAAFSFYPTKNVGALGDAGAVTTDDAELARTVRKLANYGIDEPYHYSMQGYNSRLDPIQAAFLGVKLNYMDLEINHRRSIAAIYNREIDNPLVVKPLVDPPDMSVWHQYAVRTSHRDKFREFLHSREVGTNVVYPVPPHLQKCYSYYGFSPQPVTEQICRTVVSLPISTATSEQDAREIAAIVNQYAG